MTTTHNALPKVVSRAEWLTARKQLLAKEKQATRARDAVNAERRRLPMVKIEKDYVFEGLNGKVSLLDMFEGRRQLYVHHFMWIDARDEGCPTPDAVWKAAGVGGLASGMAAATHVWVNGRAVARYRI